MPYLTIARARFQLVGPASVNTHAFPAFFLPFLLQDGSDADVQDVQCIVRCQGADESMAARTREPDVPWSFRVRDQTCEVIRRDQVGEALWRMVAPLTFAHADISWHPRRFSENYGNYETGGWRFAFGMTLLVFCLRAHGGLVLHGAAADLDGQGILCAGISGAGKSTIARLLDAAGATVLTDERPALRQWPPPTGETSATSPVAFRVYGTPWPSSAGLARNACAPLRRIYFLEHGTVDRLTPLTPREAFNRLIHVATIPWQDAALFDPCLATVETLLRSVPCAVLSFRPTPEVVELLRKDLAGM
jgi:hypothetical protein